MGVVHVEQAAAAGANGNPLQQGQALARGAALPLDALGVVGQAVLVMQVSLPGNVAGKSFGTQHWPFGLGQRVGDHFVRLAGQVGADSCVSCDGAYAHATCAAGQWACAPPSAC